MLLHLPWSVAAAGPRLAEMRIPPSPAAPGPHLPPCHDHEDIPLGSADPRMPQRLHTVQGIPAGCREPPLQGAAGSPWVPPLAEVAWGIHPTPWQLPTLPGLITTGVISHLATKSSMEYLIINHLMISLSLLFLLERWTRLAAIWKAFSKRCGPAP